MEYTVRQIADETALKTVLEMCYAILGEHYEGLYSYEAWRRRLDRSYLLLYAERNGEPLAAVLGRAESMESVVIGFAACREQFRRQGITSALVRTFEKNARLHGYSCITLTSYNNAWGFYEKCGYDIVEEKHGKKTYRKWI